MVTLWPNARQRHKLIGLEVTQPPKPTQQRLLLRSLPLVAPLGDEDPQCDEKRPEHAQNQTRGDEEGGAGEALSQLGRETIGERDLPILGDLRLLVQRVDLQENAAREDDDE